MDSINTPDLSLIVFGGLFAVLQLWWINSLMRRNRRFKGERPLTASEFRQNLERIFRNSA